MVEMAWTDPPIGLLAELTHRCPLQCPYCSNPLELERARGELDETSWRRVFDEAAKLGVLQLHLSGGEPTLRPELEALVAHARSLGLYTNLITAGVLLDETRLQKLKAAGLDHVQLSLQGTNPRSANHIGAYKGGHAKKLEVAELIRAQGLPLTINAVMHRQNLDQLDEMIELALALKAHRLEVAHVQYYGWALANRAALMPSLEQLERATATVTEARKRLKGKLAIDYVVPDYYAKRPKPCMGGWGRAVIAISPSGEVLPCHAAKSIKELSFANVQENDLQWIWQQSPAFQRFRGTDWLPEPCQSCDRRELDFGGCRCQAMALTGNAEATDPACALSPHHERIFNLALSESTREPPAFLYRKPANSQRAFTLNEAEEQS